jgi:hypothetical protein
MIKIVPDHTAAQDGLLVCKNEPVGEEPQTTKTCSMDSAQSTKVRIETLPKPTPATAAVPASESVLLTLSCLFHTEII